MKATNLMASLSQIPDDVIIAEYEKRESDRIIRNAFTLECKEYYLGKSTAFQIMADTWSDSDYNTNLNKTSSFYMYNEILDVRDYLTTIYGKCNFTQYADGCNVILLFDNDSISIFKGYDGSFYCFDNREKKVIKLYRIQYNTCLKLKKTYNVQPLREKLIK